MNILKIFFFLVVLIIVGGKILSIPRCLAQEKQEIDLDLVVGIDRIYKIDFTPYEEIHIGNLNILNYKIARERREILFNGLRPGTTSALVRDDVGNVRIEFKVNITANAQSEQVSVLREFLGDIEGLDIGIKGKQVYVGGQIVVPDDLGRITAILEKYPDVIQLFELSPYTQQVIAGKMQDEMRKFGLKDVTVRVVNKVFWIEGFVQKKEESDLAQKIAESLAPDQVQSLSENAPRIKTLPRPVIMNYLAIKPAATKPPPPPKMIKVIAQFVELSKNYSKIFGFKWNPTLAAGGGTINIGKTVTDGVTTNSEGTFAGTISNLIPRLASAKSAGYARVLQSAVVLAMDQTTSRVQKRMSIPFLLGTGEFGPITVDPEFTLEVRPQILSEEKIRLGVGVSVQMSNGAEKTGNKIETSIIATSKETAVLGGISINDGQTSYDRDPPFGQDVVEAGTGQTLFSFLRTKNYTINKSQFVVFLTPEIVESTAATTEEIKAKFRQRRR